MRTIKLTIQFDGTAYHGWQTQQQDRTVQKTVQDALATILNRPVKLHGSGRTDAGVHALGQAAHFVAESSMDIEKLKNGLNSLLPGDIAVRGLEEVATGFHARFSAQRRVYWYFIWNYPDRSPFYDRYSWHIRTELHTGLMRDAAGCLVGVHDFSSFQGSDRQEVNPVREVTRVRFKRTGKHLILFEIEAGSFLRHMVRNIMGALAEVGLGRLPAMAVEEILEKKDRRCAPATAPAHGLFLKEVKY